MKKINCIFCGLENEKAKEHIWPRWLQIEIGGNTKGVFKGSHISLVSQTELSTRTQVGETLVFGSVCNVCNNGWMSKLESDCKPIIKLLLNDFKNILQLTKIQQQILSLWAFKTALMINAGSNYRKIISEEHYKHIYNYRTLPKNIKVDLCKIKESKELSWRQSQVSFGLIPKSQHDSYNDLLSKSYKISMQIKSFGIRLVYFPQAKESGYSIKFSELKKNYRIWPFQKNPNFDFKTTYENIDDFDLDILITAST